MASDSSTARLLEASSEDHDLDRAPAGDIEKNEAYYDSGNTMTMSLRVLSKAVLLLSIRIPRQAYQWARARAATLPGVNARHGTSSSPPLRSTAWLDGLRGVAAFLVFITHNQGWGRDRHNYEMIERPWGFEGRHFFATFPVIRELFLGGGFAVGLFFVISGYVLTYKPLQLIHAQRQDALARVLASSFFRRWGRLYLPVMAVTLIWCTAWHVFGIVNANGPPPRPTYWAELKNWAWLNLIVGDAQDMNRYVWTIRVEFYASLVVWMVVLTTSSMTPIARLCVSAFLCLYRAYLGEWDTLFIIGMILCELSLLADAKRLPRFLDWYQTPHSPQWANIWLAPLLLGLYLAEFTHFDGQLTPNSFDTIPGGAFVMGLSRLSGFPEKFSMLYFRCWAAGLTILAIPQMPWCKRIFEASFPQFLGRVSYAFYLIHGPLVWSLGTRLYTAFGLHWHASLASWQDLLVLPRTGPLGLELGWLVPFFLMLGLTLLLAHYFTRFIDDISVRGVQWLYKKTLPDEKLPVLPIRQEPVAQPG